MEKSNKNTPVVKATTGVTTKATAPGAIETPVVTETPVVVETPVVTETPAVTETPVVVETPAETETKVHDAEIIPSGRFIAANGDEYEIAMNSFTFQQKTYSKEEALSDHSDVLEHLASIKSFILKKV